MTHTKVIQTPLAPGGRFVAITLFGVVFTRDKRKLDPVLIRHELIHCRQQLEWLYLPFFVLYAFEWLWHFVKLRDSYQAYRSISFEREAYANAGNPNYLESRKPYANYRRIS